MDTVSELLEWETSSSGVHVIVGGDYKRVEIANLQIYNVDKLTTGSASSRRNEMSRAGEPLMPPTRTPGRLGADAGYLVAKSCCGFQICE